MNPARSPGALSIPSFARLSLRASVAPQCPAPLIAIDREPEITISVGGGRSRRYRSADEAWIGKVRLRQPITRDYAAKAELKLIVWCRSCFHAQHFVRCRSPKGWSDDGELSRTLDRPLGQARHFDRGASRRLSRGAQYGRCFRCRSQIPFSRPSCRSRPASLSDSPLERDGFELSVRGHGKGARAFCARCVRA
jgi:hypothetical protein